MILLGDCKRLHARISERQCGINREGGHISCQGCPGLTQPGQVPSPVQEESVKKKKIECGRSGCGYGVKKEGDFCKKHQEPVVIPVEKQQRGLDDGPLLPTRYAPEVQPKLTGLAALLRTPPQPVEPDGLLIPFTREEVVALVENEVTAEDIRQLAKYLLAGELQRVGVA